MRTKERETISQQTIIVELVIISNVITKVKHMKMWTCKQLQNSCPSNTQLEKMNSLSSDLD